MAKDILIYNNIDSYSATRFIEQINESEQNAEDIVVRINTDGGDPQYGWGMIAKFQEIKGNKLVKVDGKAFSMGLYFLCYCDDSEALDVSTFVLHRAAYREWFEKDPNLFTEQAKKDLKTINDALKKAFIAKVDVEKFEEIKGIKIDQIFSIDSRIDVMLTAKESKQIGLINRIIPITPKIKAEVEDNMSSISANYIKNKEEKNNLNNDKMNLEELKLKHPELFAQIVKNATDTERERVASWLVFLDIDAKAVKEGIEKGEALGVKTMAEFTRKSMSAEVLKKIEGENPGRIETQETGKPKTEAEKNLEAFESELKKLNQK